MNSWCIIIGVFFIVILGESCVQSSTTDNMAFENVQYVDQFPLFFDLRNDAPTDFDIIGMTNLAIYDSLLIVSTNDADGLWGFYSLNDNSYLGRFIKRGNGPKEFVQSPGVFSATFFKEQGNLFAGIYDFQQGIVYKMNITNTLKNNELDMSLVCDSLPSFLFDFVLLDSLTFYCKEVNAGQTQQIRYLYSNGKRKTIENLERLNKVTLREGEDMNILSTSTKRNYAGNLIVEMPIGLNQINLYSLDNSFAKTICVGKKLDDIGKIQDKFKWNRIYTYADLRVFDNYFGVLCIDEDTKTYQISRRKKPEIQLFDWEGMPLAKIKLNRFITAFDIDFVHGNLYTLDSKTDEFYKYDIRDILKKMKK